MSEDVKPQWHIARDGKQSGPITDVEIQAVAAHGYFRATDLVWRPGFSEWRPAFSVFPPQPVQQQPAPVPPPPPAAPPAPAVQAEAPRTVQPVRPQPDQRPAAGRETFEPRTGDPVIRTGDPRTGDPRTGEPRMGERQAIEREAGEPQPREFPSAEPQSYQPQAAQRRTGMAPVQEPAAYRPATAHPADGPEGYDPAGSAGYRDVTQAAPLETATTAPAPAPAPSPRSAGSMMNAPLARSIPAPSDDTAPSRETTAWPTVPGPAGGDQTRPAYIPSQQAAPAPIHAQPMAAPRQVTAPPAGSARLPVNPPMRNETPREPLRETTRPPQRPAEIVPVSAAYEDVPPPRRGGRMAMAAIVLVAIALAGGVSVVAYPSVREVASPALKSMSAALSKTMTTFGSSGVERHVATFETRWQQTAHWPVIKREFPDWYGDRLREAAKLASEQRPNEEIAKVLVEQLVSLRRQNASSALSASTPRLKALAGAFLDNIKHLRAISPVACFNFISQGETLQSTAEMLAPVAGPPTPMQLQMAAIFEAIAEGRRTPIVHAKPQKSDYDALLGELGKLGWTQADVAQFANPRELARAEPGRVCQMVQEWFVAHIAIPDEAAQERLLGETLRPVVAG